MKGVQCYELFGGITLKIHTFSFFFISFFSAVATLVPVLKQHRLACFKAASRPESGVWLNCVPNNRVGTFIDNDTLRIGVALRVGLTVCIPHRCKCGTTVDAFVTHPLSCRFSAGRIPRHSALSDVVRRGLFVAGIPSMLEPSGLERGHGKRPDGITVYPYSRGRCLIWDAMCVNTFASSNLIRAALAAGSVDDAAGSVADAAGSVADAAGSVADAAGSVADAAGSVADAAEVRKIAKVRRVGSKLHLPASCCRDVRRHGEIDDPVF